MGRMRKAFIIIFIVVVFMSFLTGYLITYEKTKNINKGNNTVNANTSNESIKPLINQNTVIKKRDIYIGGIRYVKENQSEVTNDIIGMDKISYESYLENKGYRVENFTSKEISIYKEFDGFCPGTYVSRLEDDGYVYIYRVSLDGKLVEGEQTSIGREAMPEESRIEFSQGKTYETKEEAEYQLYEDYDS